jgi:ATP synthase, F1 delta subunit
MNTGVVATRYAKAIYQYALEKGEEDRIYEAFVALAGNYLRYPELRTVLKDPTVSDKHKSEVLLTACGSSFGETLRNVIHLILKNGRIDYLENITWVYEEYYRKFKEIVIAKLTTVNSADEEIKKELVDVISRITQHQVEFHTVINPDIIGGFVLEIENKLLDASVKTQLNRMRTDLIKH